MNNILRMVTLEQINRYRKAYKNWISVMWNLYRKKEPIIAILKNGLKLNLNYLEAILLSFSIKIGLDENKSLELIKNEKILFRNKEIVLHGMTHDGDVKGVFFNEEYKFLDVKDKIVIDIGANIGDSAIYFALNGAKKVIALEPYPATFAYLLSNIRDNNLQEKVIPLNAGYGKDGEVTVNPGINNTGGLLLTESINGVKIKTYSLKSLVEQFSIENAILKMDCEGCEYNLLNEKNETLQKFIQIQIEFHYGYKNLESKLKEAGFSVTHSKPTKSGGTDQFLKKMALMNKDLTQGYIYATQV